MHRLSAPTPALLVLVLVAAFGLAGCVSSVTPNHPAVAPSAATLADALRGADRVEVGNAGQPSRLVRRSPTVGTEFVHQVPIEPHAGELHCDCGAVHEIRFYAGERLLVELSLHDLRALRWEKGPWTSDALIAGERGRSYTDWFYRIGGTLGQLLATRSGPITDLRKEHDDANALFLASFPAATLPIVRWEGSMTRQGLDPWREPSKLRELEPDGVTLARAAFSAFGVQPEAWLVDNYRTAAIQTAVETLPTADIAAAIVASANDERALRGAARMFLRLSLHTRFDPAFNTQWLPRFADAVMRSGRPMDKPIMLLYLAKADQSAGWAFLREIAQGRRTYPWATACPLPGDSHLTMPHEPSLREAAAVLLATHGDRAVIPATADTDPRVRGLNRAAREIAVALLDPTQPVRPEHFRFRSHVLGYAAAEALARRPATDAPALALGAALAHEDHWVRGRVQPIAMAAEIELRTEPAEVNLYRAPVEQQLASTDPAEAIRQCTAQLPTSKGAAHTALLLIRAVAYETQGNAPLATADFEAALKAGGYSPEIIHGKLAWLRFRQGQLPETAAAAESALRIKPEADLLVLRGLLDYAAEDFSPATEMYFTTALGLSPNHGYAAIYQHLTSLLGGRPELSRLRVVHAPHPQKPHPTTITVGPGGTVGLNFGPAAVDPWAATLLSFFKGELTAEELLDRAKPRPGVPATQALEANFYVAQQARLIADTRTERSYLERCVVTPMPELAEYRLAVLRLDRLKGGTAPSR